MEHSCEGLKDAGGAAVDAIYYEKGCWGMGNDEYWTYPIYYCPFCGIRLEPLIKEVE